MVECTGYRSDGSCDGLAKFEDSADNVGNLEKTQKLSEQCATE